MSIHSSERNTYLLGQYQPQIESWLEQLQKKNILGRIWNRDPQVWTQSLSAHAEIKNRLGWLLLPQSMKKVQVEIDAFAQQVQEAGFKHCVLLGMGGSSLAPELFQKMLQPGTTSIAFHILDSTDPGQVSDISAKIEADKTLFIVSSKSGGTIELLSFFKYFYARVAEIKKDKAGENFIAITDPDTPLVAMAKKYSFRNVFQAASDVGGRFSALSHFGLVPAAIMGVDIRKLLGIADKQASLCTPAVPPMENVAAVLGACMAILSENSRDKLTLVTPSSWSSFSDWAEQLVAESSGKDGVGIVPVCGEALSDAHAYDKDRFFVGILGACQQSQELELKLKELAKHGHPVVIYKLEEPYEIAGEFFKWEMATAIACSLMKVNAFDQPDVQAAKDQAKALLKKIEDKHAIESPENNCDLDVFFENIEPNNYIAILAFLPDRPNVRQSLEKIRALISAKTKKAVTVGFGPRYLHSTGQLHKGGANNGAFLLLSADRSAEDMAVPGERYSFAQLLQAQAIGDLMALKSKARWTYHFSLTQDMNASLEKVSEDISTALSAAAVS